MKTFVKSMKKILIDVSDEMLEVMFLKVDIECNGFITWVRRAPLLPQVAGGRLEGTGLGWSVELVIWKVEDGGSHNIRKPSMDSGVHAG